MPINIDINELDDIKPTRGGLSKSSIGVVKSGYLRWNEPYMEENKDFKDANSVDIKGLKKDGKIIIAFTLRTDRNGKFIVNSYKNENGDIKSKSFSLRSVFKHIGSSYMKFAQDKSIELKLENKESGNKKYYIFELNTE